MSESATLLLVNRSSRAGRELDVDALRARLATDGNPVLVREGERFEVLERAVERESLADLGRIVVAGGDGTVSGLCRFAVDGGLSYGVIPCGTANDFARSIRMPADPLEAASCIAGGETRHLDVGCIDDLYFLNAAGFGLGTYVTKSLEPGDKKQLGVLAYAKSLRDALARRRTFIFSAGFDDKEVSERVWQVTVTNGRRYGGGVSAPSGAGFDDGKLHMVRVMPQPMMALAAKLPRFLRGDLSGLQKVRVDSAAEVEIHTDEPIQVSVDGELIAQTPCRIRCLPAALRVIVPAYSHGPDRGSSATGDGE